MLVQLSRCWEEIWVKVIVVGVCGVRGELSIVLVSVAAVGGGEQLHIVGGGVAPTTIVTGWGKGVFSVKKRIF